MTKSALFGAAALALTVTVAGAAEDKASANYRLPSCRNYLDSKSQDGLLLQGVCIGTLRGILYVAGGLREFSPLDDDVRRQLCINFPATATGDQLVRVVITYIEARPARMHESFDRLAFEAVRDAWPCK